ncbi:LemA family protein [Spiroplasma floricola]|uniref:LemA protein n=1 Tax=Spiroplasma floricola 23-6 TaxID=1336749 RepID=A0A2K8SEK0_9MOLU|nr:LemA family protein [Spiroplasma floricola]AUB31887.1 LemA protein [Spiroplasma floricola 23-6]
MSNNQTLQKENINKLAGTKVKRNGFGAFIWYISFILIIPLFVHIANINKLKRYDIKVSEAQSGIDIQLKKRRDILLKLINAVKDGIKFEKEMLLSLTQMRTGVNPNELNENMKLLDKVSKDVTMRLENYPQLQSTKLVQELMSAVSEVENDISASRRIYNSNVSIFNQTISVYPLNSAARQLNFVYKYLLEFSSEELEDVEIKF